MDKLERTNFFGVERRSETGGDFGEGVEDRSGTSKKNAPEETGKNYTGNLEETYVPSKPRKRFFKADEKIAICEEAAKAPKGKVGAVLRKYGIYWSQLSTWRKIYNMEGRDGLTGANRKKEKKAMKALEKEIKKLKKENEKLAEKLKKSEMIIDVQKKISEILGVPQPDPKEFGEDE